MITGLLHRRRLLIWLLRAYIKKRRQTIAAFFFFGIVAALFLYLGRSFLSPFIPRRTETIGIVGSYTIETLPLDLQNRISLGLTRLTEKGNASSSAALSYTVSNDGKAYTFTLRDDLYWQDGKKFSAGDVNYNFKDVQTHVKNGKEIEFVLKEPFAPFPTVLSQPLFRKGLVGLSGGGTLSGFGEYRVANIDLKGSQVISLTIEGNTKETRGKRIMYKMYSNEEEAKIRFMLGEVGTLVNLVNPGDLANWKHIKVTQIVAYNQLVTLFYNTTFPLLSDKTARQALTYALPRDFTQDAKANSPLSKTSWAYEAQDKYNIQNIDTAKKLLGDSKEASKSGKLAFTITTTPQFKNLAEKIKEAWKQINIDTTIQVVETIPSDPQILLERFKIPNDPDQYVLWHSTQGTNISHFSSPKVDKLLEDGRQTTNTDERLQIYADFQKYLVDESPAAFLYYPTVYTISRK